MNPIELLQTVPGVQIVDQNLGLGGVGGNFYQIEVNGARPRSNNFMMDGQDINDVGIGGQAFNINIPDVFQSVTALTNSSSAEYGRSGGAVVNLITKSGTNQYHGDVWELYTGSGLDSLDGISRQAKPNASPKARYDQHQIGFTVGGPIWKNKVYGFGGAQFSRFYGNSQPGSVELPDAAGYAQLTAIGGPQVALLDSYLSGGKYLSTYANVGAANQYKISPRGGCTAGCSISTALFQRPPVAQQEPETQWLYRIDFIPSAKDSFSFRYLHDRSNFNPYLALNTSGLPGFDSEVGGPAEIAQGTWTHVLSPRLAQRAACLRDACQFPLPANAGDNTGKPAVEELQHHLPRTGFRWFDQPAGHLAEHAAGNKRRALSVSRHRQLDPWSSYASFRCGRGAPDRNRCRRAERTRRSFFRRGRRSVSALDNFLDNFLGASGSAGKTFGPTRIDPHTWKTGCLRSGRRQADIRPDHQSRCSI